MSSKEEIQLLREELNRYRAKMDEEIKELNHRIDCTQKWTQENFLMDGALREVNHRIDLTQSLIDFTDEAGRPLLAFLLAFRAWMFIDKDPELGHEVKRKLKEKMIKRFEEVYK